MYSYSDCNTSIPSPVCDLCPTPELGRVGSFALISHEGYESIIDDPSNASGWQTLIDADDGSIFIFPGTQGNFDGGTPKTAPGYGRVHLRRLSSEYKLTIKDNNYILNAPFWDAVQDAQNYHPVFLSETQMHIGDKPVAIVPKAPIEDDDESEVVWTVEMTWVGKRYPVPHDIPEGIFECVVSE